MLLTKLANQEIINFLRTVTIKNGYFAEQLKKALVNVQYWDSLPADRNPYNLHLAGRYILRADMPEIEVTDPTTGIKTKQTYSSSFDLPNADGLTTTRVRNSRVYNQDAFDEMMYVTSLDTQEIIPFTVENLHGDAANAASAVHKKTLEAYKIPGRYYDMLCEKYPKQVDLIKSIVYLVPSGDLQTDAGTGDPLMDRIINAGHLEVLNYDDSVLDSRERTSLVDAMKATLDVINKRWNVEEYTYEENFAGVQWSMIWSILPLILVAQRYANVRTPAVHSSHIWDYLTSKGLDSYRGYLTPDQELFLYKNIQFLRENSGQHRVLNILIDNLLADYKLHIEAKTVVMDKTSVTVPKTQSTVYSDQCATCARSSLCFKKITDYKCDEWLGKKDLYKPEPVVLTENLPGARKDKIIELLKTRYDCTEEEAQKRYDRSFVWHDQAIEIIQKELDRDQTIDMNGLVEQLADVIYRAFESKLEPTYNDGVVQEQRNDIRVVPSNYLPTKLLEITEDPVEPKFDELFTKFLTDTLLHLAPRLKDGTALTRVTESYSVTVGQEALSFIFSFSELIAAMYLGFVKENLVNLKIDKVTENFEGKKTWITEYLTNLKAYNTFDFKIPDRAVLGTTFKLGTPVKQQELVESWESEDRVDLHDLVTNPSDEFKVVEIGDRLYAVSRRPRTNLDDIWLTYFDEKTKSSIATTVYAYDILGRFTVSGLNYQYTENDGEIGIIPRYFLWHYDHLTVRTFKTVEDMNAHAGSCTVGTIAYVWRDKDPYILRANGSWTDAQTTELQTISKVVFIRNPPNYPPPDDPSETTPASSVDAVQVHQQNPLKRYKNGILLPEESFASTENMHRDDGTLNKPDTWTLTDTEFTSYKDFQDWVDSSTAEVYEKCELAQYINIDWILQNLWVDFLHSVTKQDEIGAYLEKMFTIIERLETIRTACGDIKTKLAVKTFMQAVLLDRDHLKGTSKANNEWYEECRKTYSFKLVQIANNPSPTYADWIKYNSEVGDNLTKLDASLDRDNLWNEFNTKLLQEILKGCGLSYATTATDKTKYSKLKALVKSLSSYLINFIDNDSVTRTSTEISHLAENCPAHQLTFTSHTDFDPVGEIDIVPPIPDLNGELEKLVNPPMEQIFSPGDLFVPADVLTARFDPNQKISRFIGYPSFDKMTLDPYFIKDLDAVEDQEFKRFEVENLEDIIGEVVKYDTLAGWIRFIPKERKVYYSKVNFCERLGVRLDEGQRLKVFSETEGLKRSWYYAKGYDIPLNGSQFTNKGRLDKLPFEYDGAIGDLYFVNESSAYWVYWIVNGTATWVNLGNWSGTIETYPADTEVISVVNAKLTDLATKLIGSGNSLNNLGNQIYLKYDSRVITAWEDPQQDSFLTQVMEHLMKKDQLTAVSKSDCLITTKEGKLDPQPIED